MEPWRVPSRHTDVYKRQLLDLETHPLSNIDEQLAIFDDSKGPSQAQLHQSDIAAFFSGVGRITADEAAKVADGKYATDKYLKLCLLYTSRCV